MDQRMRDRSGFSIIELIVALVILSIGLLSLAATTGYLAANIRVSDLRTQRSAALHHSIEQLRATPFDNVAQRDSSASVRVGEFKVWWDVTSINANLKAVSVYSELAVPVTAAAKGAATRDTFMVTIARP